MAIQRNDTSKDKGFSANINIILTGSKNMSIEEQAAAMTVDGIRILITDVNDPNNILLDSTAHSKEFTTRSVGYGLQQSGLQFKKEN